MRSLPHITVKVVDAAGVQKTFAVSRLGLDCGVGCLDIRPGKPAFCRGFEHGILTLDDGHQVTTLDVTHGMASLDGDQVHVICEHALPGLPHTSADQESNFPPQPTEAATENQKNENYSI